MKNTWGVDAFNMGFVIDLSYSKATGTVYTTTKSSGASGTVNNIDRRSLLASYGIGYDVSSQYGFTWDFGMRTWTAGDQKIPVFGYVLTNLRAAPPVPTLTGVSVTDNRSAKITWQAPTADLRRPYAGYHVWMRMDDGDFVCVTDAPLSDTTFEYTYNTLKGDTTYTFAVSSVGNNGTVSALSNTKTFSTFAGAGGREIEFRNNGSSIQWRYTGEDDSAFRDLVALADLTGSAGSNGTDGKQVELRAYDGYIQWKYIDDTVWNNLIALSELKGDKGDKGDTGDKGDKGDTGDKGDPGKDGAPGRDGVDGKDGAPGKDGADGKDGKDGTTPMLKIGDDNIWYVSYDGGRSWTSLGVKATGEKGEKGDKGDTGTDGKNGADGKDGIDGKDGTNGQDGIGVSTVTVDKDGSITVTLTDGSTHRAGSVPVTKEEVQALKITAGAAAGTAGVSLVGLLSAIGYALLKRKKLS